MPSNTPISASLEQFCRVRLSLRPETRLEYSALGGDAGFRRYYRLNTIPPMLAVDAPPATEDSEQFVRVATFFTQAGVRVPRVYACDSAAGHLLVEDFGDRVLLADLDEFSVDSYYSEALTQLLHLQSADPDLAVFANYDERVLSDEMQLCDEWFVRRLLNLDLSDREEQILKELRQVLVDRACAQIQVVVHRDYHSRNIMVLDDGGLATLDFQDALIGPLTYDLVSLLKDCYIRWPRERTENWARTYGRLLHDAGVMPQFDESAFLSDFHSMGLQRHLKVLGIFARLYLRDQKPGYLHDLPLVLRYTLEVLSDEPQFDSARALFEGKILPRAREQSWYR